MTLSNLKRRNSCRCKCSSGNQACKIILGQHPAVMVRTNFKRSFRNAWRYLLGLDRHLPKKSGKTRQHWAFVAQRMKILLTYCLLGRQRSSGLLKSTWDVSALKRNVTNSSLSGSHSMFNRQSNLVISNLAQSSTKRAPRTRSFRIAHFHWSTTCLMDLTGRSLYMGRLALERPTRWGSSKRSTMRAQASSSTRLNISSTNSKLSKRARRYPNGKFKFHISKYTRSS